jgi:3-hydroxyacyl-[acyl-carrier-protein] dehydratase
VRYLLLDEIPELIEGKTAKGVKCVTLTDELLRDHFRWAPIFPGSMIIEAMAQLAGALIEETAVAAGRPRDLAVLAGVDRARFLRGVHPGQRLELSASYQSDKELLSVLSSEARVGAHLVAEAELKFVLNREAHEELIAERRRVRALWRTGNGYGAGALHGVGAIEDGGGAAGET